MRWKQWYLHTYIVKTQRHTHNIHAKQIPRSTCYKQSCSTHTHTHTHTHTNTHTNTSKVKADSPLNISVCAGCRLDGNNRFLKVLPIHRIHTQARQRLATQSLIIPKTYLCVFSRWKACPTPPHPDVCLLVVYQPTSALASPSWKPSGFKQNASPLIIHDSSCS